MQSKQHLSKSVKQFFINARQSGSFSIVNIASVVYLVVLGFTVYDFYDFIPSLVLIFQGAIVGVLIVNLIVYKIIRNINLGAFVLILCIFSVHMANVNFAGGISTPHYAWILMVPILAGATIGWRGQVFFLALTVIGTIYYFLFPEQITNNPYENDPSYILLTRLLILVVCSLIMISYYLTLDEKITDLNTALKRASFESSLFLGIFNTKAQNVLLLDKEGVILRANDLAKQTFELKDHQLAGTHVNDICLSGLTAFSAAPMPNTEKPVEQKLTLLSGQSRWFEWATVSIEDTPENIVSIMILEDITSRKNHEAQLSYLAHYDDLTKLPNRVLVHNRLSELIEAGKRYNRSFSVLFIDLDKFKNINDTASHEAGDLVLKTVARRVQKLLRRSDIIARFGGDEFVLLLDEIQHREHIITILNKIQTSISKPIVIEEEEYFVTSSIGISRFPLEGKTASELLRKSDAAMFKAKKVVGSSYEFYDTLQNDNLKRDMKISAELNYAIERDELELLFQPIVDDTQRIIGAEALLRWKHDTLGRVSPDEFIPICEESGLIVSIGHWVLKEACKAVKRWHEIGFSELFVSVNVSYRQINKTELVRDIADVLGSHSLDGKYLILELTERVFADDLELVKLNIEQFTGLGVKTAIDDFGVGYSSLSYLRHTAFSSIKIDKSFVNGIEHSESAKNLCGAIAAMAESLELTVTAEGVETKEQLDILSEFNIDKYQGYYFAKPMSVEDFEQRMQKQKAGPQQQNRIRN